MVIQEEQDGMDGGHASVLAGAVHSHTSVFVCRDFNIHGNTVMMVIQLKLAQKVV